MQGVDKNKVVRAVILKITEESEPKIIRAKDLDDFENPDVIEDGKGKFVPDISVDFDKYTNLYAIELEDDNPVSKWKTFAEYAKENKGHLYIVAPDYLKERIKKEITDNDFNAGLIYFST